MPFIPTLEALGGAAGHFAAGAAPSGSSWTATFSL